MKIGLFQNSAVWENKAASKSAIEKLLASHNSPMDMLIFPEMTLTGFTMNAATIAEDTAGNTAEFFSRLARERNTAIIAGYVLQDADAYYNCAVYFDRTGKQLGCYRKIHPFSYANENRFYSPGTKTVLVREPELSVGLSVCYDLRFPELYRLYGKQRISMLVNIANWPVRRIEHWRTLLQARAIENLCFMIGVNRTGNDPAAQYTGHSMVVAPNGTVIYEQPTEETLHIVEIDLPMVEQTRNRFPFLEDIRLI